MADIKMIKYHDLTIAKAKQLVQKTADALGEEYDLTSEWHGDTLRFHRSGVQGQMKVTASEIHLDVTLGFLLKPFKSNVSGGWLARYQRLVGPADIGAVLQ